MPLAGLSSQSSTSIFLIYDHPPKIPSIKQSLPIHSIPWKEERRRTRILKSGSWGPKKIFDPFHRPGTPISVLSKTTVVMEASGVRSVPHGRREGQLRKAREQGYINRLLNILEYPNSTQCLAPNDLPYQPYKKVKKKRHVSVV